MNTKQLLELCKNEVQDDGLFELYSELFLKIAESAYEAGREEGYEKGFDDGYEKGFDDGYEDGHAKGWREAEEFYNL